jgi:uncharacterized protein YggT (Ycf19 family)
MALTLSILQTLIFVALLSQVGQFAVALFCWRRRRENPIYRLFDLVGSPARHVVRRLMPRAVPDTRIPALAFALLCCAYLGVGFSHRDVCLGDLNQSGCEKWLRARAARGIGDAAGGGGDAIRGARPAPE